MFQPDPGRDGGRDARYGVRHCGRIFLQYHKFEFLHRGSEYFLIGTNGRTLLAFMVKENGERVNYVESKGDWKR